MISTGRTGGTKFHFFFFFFSPKEDGFLWPEEEEGSEKMDAPDELFAEATKSSMNGGDFDACIGAT